MLKKTWEIAKKISPDLTEQLLANRGITGKEEIEQFLDPPVPTFNFVKDTLAIDLEELEKAEKRIKEAIRNEECIIIHGDYDVDGLCATAILWEAIYYDLNYKNVSPFIPDRFGEGYGLSVESINKIKRDKFQTKGGLLITVDCGITAIKEVRYAKKLGLDVVVTDHHTQGEVLPEAAAIIHTEDISGACIAWLLSEALKTSQSGEPSNLDLVALSTIADLQELLGINRFLVKYGLLQLHATKREGLKALIKVANVGEREITPYIVSWWLAPRLNALGRLENALDSLRLLCTQSPNKALSLAQKLNRVNWERQQMTNLSVEQARQMVNTEKEIQVLYHEEWHEGVIGLVAGKIKEEFYRPVIAIAKRERYSKGSARSIANFNIVEALRRCEDCLVDVGGHPLAAGFTIETSMIEAFVERLTKIGRESLSFDNLLPVINIDAEIKLSEISWSLLEKLKKFEPHGIGNPRPVFLSRDLEVLEVKTVGMDHTHLKLLLAEEEKTYSAIGFGLGPRSDNLNIQEKIDLVFTLSENLYNGQKEIQIEVKDIDNGE